LRQSDFDAEPGSGLRPIPGIARPHKDPIVNRTTLHLLTIALAIVLAVLLATFDRADMPKPLRGNASSASVEKVADRPVDGGTLAKSQLPPGAAAVAGGLEVRDDGLVATWFAPSSGTVGPALLVLGGSEGGKEITMRLAASLHAKGYGALALAYFGAEGLPDQLEEIPLEYFTRALDWLARQPGVDPSRIGVIGGSKGAEAALLLASRDRRVRAVLAFTPSDYAWQSVDWNDWSDTPSWTEAGAPVPYLRYTPFDPAAGLRAMYDRSVAEAGVDARNAARIPIENSVASVMLVAGEQDALWGAVAASDRIAATLAAAGHAHEVLVLSYAEAGHVVFIGGPLAVDDPLLERILPMGGTREGVITAINDAWPKSLAFLERNLRLDENDEGR
jgi:dienelactone hydrolase